MEEKILQLNFKVKVSGREYQAAVAPLADEFAAVPGLRWKIWYEKNDKEAEAGGIYLFDDQASLDEFLTTDLVKTVMSHPALSDFTAKQFNVLERESTITRAPIGARVGA